MLIDGINSNVALKEKEVIIWSKSPEPLSLPNTTSNFMIVLVIAQSAITLMWFYLAQIVSVLYFVAIGFLLFLFAMIFYYFKSKKHPKLLKEEYYLTNFRLIKLQDQKVTQEKFLKDILSIEKKEVKSGICTILIDKEIRWANKMVQYTSMESYQNEYSKNTFVLWNMSQSAQIIQSIKQQIQKKDS